MGMCVIRGPRVLRGEAVEESDVATPRSCAAATSAYGSASSQELDHIADEVGRFFQDGAIWQRAIPRGRRCKPLSFSGVILYDQNGILVTAPHRPEDDDDDEYFSPLPKNLAEQEEAFRR